MNNSDLTPAFVATLTWVLSGHVGEWGKQTSHRNTDGDVYHKIIYTRSVQVRSLHWSFIQVFKQTDGLSTWTRNWFISLISLRSWRDFFGGCFRGVAASSRCAAFFPSRSRAKYSASYAG